MKIYRLYYVYSNNPETGEMGCYHIAQSSNKDYILNIIKREGLKVKETLKRGEDHIYVLDSFEPTFPEYYDEERLRSAQEDDIRRHII